MKRVLAWLLVPLLPLVGLIHGIWLMPENKPHWEVSFQDNMAVKGLGFVDGGKTLLCVETKLEPGRQTISNNAFGVIGLDAQTGEQLFRTPFTDELLKGEGVHYANASLTADGQGILLNRRVVVDPPQDTYDEMVVYDWKTQQITKRYRTVYKNGAPNWPALRGSTLAVMGSAHDIHNLILWNGTEDKPTIYPLSKSVFDFGVSDDGAMVHVCAAYVSPFQLILIDAKNQKVNQTIEGHFREVRWAADHQSFLAVEYDPKQKVHVARRYQLENQQYVLVPQSEVAIAHTGNVSRGKPYLTMTTYTQLDPWRTRIAALLGVQFKFIVDRLWPEGQVVQLHDDLTGQLLRKLVLPKDVRGDSIIHPDHQSVAMTNWRTASLWEFSPASRWYPLYGFTLGLVLASLLARRLLRQRPKATNSLSPGGVK